MKIPEGRTEMKIPENANPYRVIVNGVEHAYEAGEETTVAPGVEELINAADNFPPAAEEVKPPFAGGGGGGGALVVKLTTPDNRNFTADKTMGEIFEAAKTGSVVFTRDITDPSVPGFVTTQISQIVQILEYTGQGYGVCIAMPVVNLSSEATSRVVFDLLPLQTTSLDDYPTGVVQQHPDPSA